MSALSSLRHVRIAVACVISLLADEEPRLFAEKFLDGTFRFLVGLAQSDERNAAFEAIGEIVLAVGGDAFAPFLDDAFDLIYDALAPVKNGIKRQPARSPVRLQPFPPFPLKTEVTRPPLPTLDTLWLCELFVN